MIPAYPNAQAGGRHANAFCGESRHTGCRQSLGCDGLVEGLGRRVTDGWMLGGEMMAGGVMMKGGMEGMMMMEGGMGSTALIDCIAAA